MEKEFEIKWVYGILPSFWIVVPDNKVPYCQSNGGAFTCGPVCIISFMHMKDEGLIAHELTHIKQWYRGVGTHIKKLKNPEYRLKCEIEAFRVQSKIYNDGVITKNLVGWLIDNFKFRNIDYTLDYDSIYSQIKE